MKTHVALTASEVLPAIARKGFWATDTIVIVNLGLPSKTEPVQILMSVLFRVLVIQKQYAKIHLVATLAFAVMAIMDLENCVPEESVTTAFALRTVVVSLKRATNVDVMMDLVHPRMNALTSMSVYI